jgi:hypothetical protein
MSLEIMIFCLDPSASTNHNNSIPIVRFSEFIGIGYYGDEKQNVICPIFDSKNSAERAWIKVMEAEHGVSVSALYTVFVEHANRYEIITYPTKMKYDKINYAIYRSFTSMNSLNRFKKNCNAKTFIKFGWHDLTKKFQFDVLEKFAVVVRLEFVQASQIPADSILCKIRNNENQK